MSRKRLLKATVFGVHGHISKALATVFTATWDSVGLLGKKPILRDDKGSPQAVFTSSHWRVVGTLWGTGEVPGGILFDTYQHLLKVYPRIRQEDAYAQVEEAMHLAYHASLAQPIGAR